MSPAKQCYRPEIMSLEFKNKKPPIDDCRPLSFAIITIEKRGLKILNEELGVCKRSKLDSKK